jgi:hypothetical protein
MGFLQKIIDEKTQKCLLLSIINYYFDKFYINMTDDLNFYKIISKLNNEKLLKQLLDFLLFYMMEKVCKQNLI